MKIATAYDAFWFLMEHSKLNCNEARLVSSAAEVKLLREATLPNSTKKLYRIRTIKDSTPGLLDKKMTHFVAEYRALRRRAFECNLAIFWARVDAKRRINDDHTKNTFVECSLELGPIKYVVWDGTLHLERSYDPRLDCGAPTFDQALIRLAHLVRKHYGEIKTPMKTGKQFLS